MQLVTLLDGDANMEYEAMDLREDVVDPVLDELCSQLRESFIAVDNQLDLVPTNHIPVKGNRDWLRTVFRKLLKNVIDHGGKGCTVCIGMEDSTSVFKLSVVNADGPLAFQDPSKLLLRLGHDAANGGMGLLHAREAQKKHGREVWYEA
jgi:hypothetical protein